MNGSMTKRDAVILAGLAALVGGLTLVNINMPSPVVKAPVKTYQLPAPNHEPLGTLDETIAKQPHTAAELAPYRELAQHYQHTAMWWLGAAVFAYFIPTFFAICRKKANSTAIFVVNFFLGWTFIGWVVALTWALMKDQAPVLRSC